MAKMQEYSWENCGTCWCQHRSRSAASLSSSWRRRKKKSRKGWKKQKGLNIARSQTRKIKTKIETETRTETGRGTEVEAGREADQGTDIGTGGTVTGTGRKEKKQGGSPRTRTQKGLLQGHHLGIRKKKKGSTQLKRRLKMSQNWIMEKRGPPALQLRKRTRNLSLK